MSYDPAFNIYVRNRNCFSVHLTRSCNHTSLLDVVRYSDCNFCNPTTLCQPQYSQGDTRRLAFLIEGFCDDCRSLFLPCQLSLWREDIRQRHYLQDELLDLEIRANNFEFDENGDDEDLEETREYYEWNLARNLERQRVREEQFAELIAGRRGAAEERRLQTQEPEIQQQRQQEGLEMAPQLRTRLSGIEEQRTRERARIREQNENEEEFAELRHRVSELDWLADQMEASMTQLPSAVEEDDTTETQVQSAG